MAQWDDDQVGERRVPQHVRYGECHQTPRSRWGVMYILFHAVMIGLGTTMYRFVDWFEPNRRLAQILKILVLVPAPLRLSRNCPREKAPTIEVGASASSKW